MPGTAPNLSQDFHDPLRHICPFVHDSRLLLRDCERSVGRSVGPTRSISWWRGLLTMAGCSTSFVLGFAGVVVDYVCNTI